MDKNELQAWEYKCIQEEPPRCTSGCPIHVDARLFLKQAGLGRWDEALKTLAKTMPFPRILGRICDHPCETVCKRGDVEQPIAIGTLERICVETAHEKVKGVILGRKQTTVAVIGSGLSSLTAAWDLLRKGYQVTLFEPGQRLGRNLWDYPEAVLPPAVIAEELSILESIGATIELSCNISETDYISNLRETFDAVFIGLDSPGLNCTALEQNENGIIQCDSLTKATSLDGVFAGGNVSKVGCSSPIFAVLDGRRAATSIDRYTMNSSMSNGRELEGPYTSRLYTNTGGLAPLPRISPADAINGYTPEEAHLEAERCLQCECLECVKVCLYLDRYKGYPKKYARQVFNNEYVMHGRARTKNLFVNSCSNCGLCATVCPNNFHVGEMMLQARKTLLKGNFMPPSFHEFALQDMAHSNGEHFSLSSHEPGKDSSAWLYFPSCQLCSTSPGEVEASYGYLRENLDGGVAIMLRCCGAPAYWAGREDLFREAQDVIRQEWEKLGKPPVITACSTCRSLFQDQIPDMETHTLWEIVEKHGLPASSSPCGSKTISITDPCMSRHDGETQASVRRITQSLGFSVEELSLSGDKAECCGFGGLMFNADKGMANDVIQHRTTIIDPPATSLYRTEVKEHDYLAYCAMCRDNLVAGGKRTSHLIEHLFPTVPGNDPAGRGWISWSERRANRAGVKQAILRERGLNGVTALEDYEKIALLMTPEVRRKIDERRILEADIKKVIDHAERTGKRLQSARNGLFRTYLQSENVTFWVDYTPAESGFTVHNAFCHRMKIVGIKL
ncbi:MAG: 4Fe-4S dicluster domain-containing protein [Desulfuromonadales bacterium]|nr:4Fe-4S dicluster domain-containing protein [Desulfuromonadales bacterium]